MLAASPPQGNGGIAARLPAMHPRLLASGHDTPAGYWRRRRRGGTGEGGRYMHIERTTADGGTRFAVRGRWVADHCAALEHAVAEAASDAAGPVSLDATGLESLDITGAWLLRSLERRLERSGTPVTWSGERPPLLAFIDRAAAEAPPDPGPPRGALPAVAQPLRYLGRQAVVAGKMALEVVALLGAVCAVMAGALAQPRRFRLPSIVRHVYDTGLTAVPIVALIAFLISVIVAYIGAIELRQFGGEIFVVDLVAISVLRELGVLLTAIIVAGRSGSAFAAEIGVMQLNDEVDALRAIGMDPVEVLVVPRIVGLVIALPLLTIVADAMGLAGGALLSWSLVDIPWDQYVARVEESLAPTTFWVGVIKAPVFAFLIAYIGTLRGLQVRGSSRELGRLTTEAVVQSIFLVILADAIFAVIFMELDI